MHLNYCVTDDCELYRAFLLVTFVCTDKEKTLAIRRNLTHNNKRKFRRQTDQDVVSEDEVGLCRRPSTRNQKMHSNSTPSAIRIRAPCASPVNMQAIANSSSVPVIIHRFTVVPPALIRVHES